jgi:alpha-galactosidase
MRNRSGAWVALAVLLAAPSPAAATLAATPPMGWDGWNSFGDRVDDFTVRAEVDVLVAGGMRAAGYTYVLLDDGWQGERDARGVLHPNARFSDMRALADYLHARGLKLGIYSSPGPTTCANYAGSFGHEALDAQTYADWGIDYLKYDWCSASSVYAEADMATAFKRMGDAVRATGRPIVYSISEYGIGEVWRWGPQTGAQLWRTTADISPSFTRIYFVAAGEEGLERFVGPGRWNDPDMLEVGNGALDDDEGRTQMSLWALLAAPLIAGNDLTRMRADVSAILSDPEVIAIDQDSAGKQGDRVRKEGPLEIWVKPLSSGAKAVGIFNFGAGDLPAALRLSDIGRGQAAKVRDVWHKRDLGIVTGGYTWIVPEHGVVLLVVT